MFQTFREKSITVTGNGNSKGDDVGASYGDILVNIY